MLTEVKCKNSLPKEKAYKIYDSKGLFLLINPSGSKLWRMKYSLDKKEYKLAFGPYPAISLKAARLKRDEAYLLIEKGVNPAVEKRMGKLLSKGETFRDLFGIWFGLWSVGKAAKTVSACLAVMEKYIFPDLGGRGAKELEAYDFVQVLHKTQNMEVSFTPTRLFQRCSQVMRCGVAHGIISRNPLADIKPTDILKPHTSKNYSRIQVLELPKLINDINEYQGHIYTRYALKLMLLTFVRTKELIKGTKDEIDWEAKLWRIPADRMKMKDDHLVPLSRQTIVLLRGLFELSGNSEMFFPGHQKAKTISNNTIIYALYRMGYHSRMTGHGFRGLASTQLHEMGFPESHIELQLAHQKRNNVAAAYNHAKYLEQRRVMMQAWADYIDSAS